METTILAVHGCESSYLRNVWVVAARNGEEYFSGDVGVFRLLGHPSADHAFAWLMDKGGTTRAFAALDQEPTTSPLGAVQAAAAFGF